MLLPPVQVSTSWREFISIRFWLICCDVAATQHFASATRALIRYVSSVCLGVHSLVVNKEYFVLLFLYCVADVCIFSHTMSRWNARLLRLCFNPRTALVHDRLAQFRCNGIGISVMYVSFKKQLNLLAMLFCVGYM